MKFFKLIGVAVTMAVMAGCVTVEGTREQLKSGDANEVKKAERNIVRIAVDGGRKDAMPRYTVEQRISFVELTSKNDVLLEVVDGLMNNNSDDLYRDRDLLGKALSRIDFSDASARKRVCDCLHRFYDYSYLKEIGGKVSERIVAAMDESALIEHMKKSNALEDDVRDRLITIVQDPMLITALMSGEVKRYGGYDLNLKDDELKTLESKLLAQIDKITDKEKIFKMLEARDSHSLENYVTNLEVREKLISKLNEDEAAKYVLQQVRNHSVYDWNKNKLLPLQDAIAVTKNIKNRVTLVRIVFAVASKIVSHEAECRSSMGMSWGKEDEEKAISLIKGLPKLNDKEITVLLCAEGSAWMYFMDSVSSDVAYDVLTNGKKKSGYLEEELIKKLPKNRLDMKVYNAVKSADAKNAVVEAMPENLKKQVAEAAEKAFSDIFNKAKAASKETFELDGFYLGMSFDDVKVVLAHHFPDWKIKEAIDGEGKDADHVIYVPGQSSPFCYAGVGDKKVYQFNFGKKMLKKWYKYDVQTFMEWANAYERETKIDMKFKLIEKDTTVYEPDMSRSYNVWFHQVSYQYKHNTKEYRLTYFGEEKDYTFHGGIGGAIIKGMAAKDFRYVRGDPGSLRAKIERD